MRNKFAVLIKASVKAHRLQTIFFVLFLMISTMLLNITIGIILPLSNNLENKINNHISNREVVTDFEADITESELKKSIEQIEAIEYIVDVYHMPSAISVSEQSGVLKDRYELKSIHKGYEVTIEEGRLFKENEKNVAIIPQNLKDFNEFDNRVEDISGESLIGKELAFTDDFGNSYLIKIVGTYVNLDSAFSNKDIIVPRDDLISYNNKLLNSEDNLSFVNDKSYIIQVDNYKNTDDVFAEVSKIRNAYIQPSMIDVEIYHISLIILLISLAFFILLVILGFYIFLKSNINNRTSELALYRALGYKNRHIFSILLSEYLLFGSISIVLGILLTVIVNKVFVNPYLYSLFGNTLMEMKISLSIVQEIAIVIFFISILLLVCKKAIKNLEKIDLTILLREK